MANNTSGVVQLRPQIEELAMPDATLASSGSLKSTKKASVSAFGELGHLSAKDQRLFWTFGLGQPQAIPYPTIHHAFEYQAQRVPYNTAVEHLDDSMTYEELNLHATRLAELLIDLGVKPGDCVPLFLERSISMVVGILAILKTGAAYVPQHVGVAPLKQLHHVVNDTGAKVILTVSKFLQDVPQTTSIRRIAIDDFLRSSRRVKKSNVDQFSLAVDVGPDDRCLVLFTSGTTGKPNGVQVTHKNICNIILTSPGNMNIQPGDRVAQILSISFDMAAWEIHGCLTNGGTLVIRDSDIAKTAQNVNVLISTPSILSKLDPEQCSVLKSVAVAGEPCPRHVADTWSDQGTFYNACGPTETTIVNTMYPHNRDAPILTIGKPTPNNTVYILDENGKACGIGETGEMWAGGQCVTAGYLKNPELTVQRYHYDPFLGAGKIMFNTRDLGRWTEDGLLEHLGRTDDQVKIRGFRVELDSVSSKLEEVEGCVRAVALKYDNRNLVAFTSPETVDTEVARQHVANCLPYYCTPVFVIGLPELPLTPRGKIDKRVLLDIAEKRIEVDRVYAAPVLYKAKVEPDGAKPANVSVLYGADPVPKNDRAADYLATELPPASTSFSARLTHHKFYHYWRLLTLFVVTNLAFLGYGVVVADWWSIGAIKLIPIMNLVVANISIAIIFRQQYVVNLLFKIATSTPLWMPLGFRQTMGKVYHFGGIHLGGAICGTVWMVIAIVSMVVQFFTSNSAQTPSTATVVIGLELAFVLILLVVMARPSIRSKFHNGFELVHRFGGWTSLLLFWGIAVSFTNDMRADLGLIDALIASPVFWSLLVVTFSIALPWMYLKRVPVIIERPSNHVALVKFDYGVTPFAGSATTISRSPLTEWHSFANVPAPGQSGFRLTISRAGDWTGRLIDDMPSHLWVKGIPTAGVGNVDKLFRRVVWIATGSGIGPTLPHLLSREVPAHLIWSTRNARETYGDGLVDEILEVEPDALIWDTNTRGRPDLVQLAYAAVQSFEAEAVIVIANEKLTRLVVHGMESRGIPAYGAIWDS